MSDKNSKNYLYIGQKLPSLNEYIAKCRANPHVGAEFKRRTEESIGMWINACVAQGNLRPISSPCEIVMDFYEATSRRDVDNIQSAQKFILDALQAHGILPNDSQRWVKQVHHRVTRNKSVGDCSYIYLVEGKHLKLVVSDECE